MYTAEDEDCLAPVGKLPDSLRHVQEALPSVYDTFLARSIVRNVQRFPIEGQHLTIRSRAGRGDTSNRNSDLKEYACGFSITVFCGTSSMRRKVSYVASATSEEFRKWRMKKRRSFPSSVF